ncbi:MAG: D-aminoacyl-tRNA deacylase [Flavobacteriaceae bacterium]|nr:D-aminoacyl-tRNA deacylase [Flavobacteriaceae bacterium]
MRSVIQRVKHAKVTIDGKISGEIGQGLLVLIGFEADENQEDFDWMIKKIIQLRIFDDENGVMNKSVQEIDGEMLIVSQFTLHANCKKGNRPSYIRAAKPEIAIPLYEKFIAESEAVLGKKVQTGQFGADMKVELLNDGPVTIILDSKERDF